MSRLETAAAASAGDRGDLLRQASTMIEAWEQRFGSFERHPASRADPADLVAAWGAFEMRMADHYPFFHPRFTGQMLKPPHPVAAAGYLAAMLINPNNHSLDGGPGTSELEKEVVGELAGMFGLTEPWLGHLTTSGTIANLEALWVSRELHPGKAIAFSSEAHYTHARMCSVLGVEAVPVPAGPDGRIDLDAVEELCRGGSIGTVVLTAGTTGLGAVDRVEEALSLRERYGVRIHVDAAYGGFYSLLAGDGVAREPFEAIRECDSVVVDPHKHGLQPYGCGALLLADPDVGRFYSHNSPYTYYTATDLHFGEISLECSRAGAAAAALWLTLQVFPLERERGYGPMLAASRRAARSLAGKIRDDDHLALVLDPELDIVTYYPRRPSLTEIDSASAALYDAALGDPSDPFYLSSLRLGKNWFGPEHSADAEVVRVLRSVLMKPEHELLVDLLFERLRSLATG